MEGGMEGKDGEKGENERKGEGGQEVHVQYL